MKSFRGMLFAGLVGFCASAQALATPELTASEVKKLEVSIAHEFMALELTGWRLPDASAKCIHPDEFKYVVPTPQSVEEISEAKPIVLSGGEPYYKILSIERSPLDKGVREVEFNLYLRQGGKVKVIPDSFSFIINGVDQETLGTASMLAPPESLFYVKGCQ